MTWGRSTFVSYEQMHSICYDFKMYRRHYILSYEMKCIAGELSYMCSKKCEQKETCRSEREAENSTFLDNLTVLFPWSPAHLVI
jgi:hypothetical protein